MQMDVGFFMVRPAWAQTCGCASGRELTTTNEVKRNCIRVAEYEKEAWSANGEPMNKICRSIGMKPDCLQQTR